MMAELELKKKFLKSRNGKVEFELKFYFLLIWS